MEVRKEETGMIKAENLTKRFYDTVAVDHIHAEIHNGSVFGLIGTNGAGKSTFPLMEILLSKFSLQKDKLCYRQE